MDKPRNHAFAEAASRWFSRPPEHLDAAERRVLEKTVSGETLAIDTSESFSESLTFGQRMADRSKPIRHGRRLTGLRDDRKASCS
jgi:hypothetical protein